MQIWCEKIVEGCIDSSLGEMYVFLDNRNGKWWCIWSINIKARTANFVLRQIFIHAGKFNFTLGWFSSCIRPVRELLFVGPGSFQLRTSCSLWGRTRWKQKDSGKLNDLVFLTVSFSGCLHQIKVARLLKYLQFRDYKSKLLRSLEDDDLLSDTGIHAPSHTYFSFIDVSELESFVWQLCRRGWWRPAAAATGSGFPHLDGSNRWLPVTGRAPGSWPH